MAKEASTPYYYYLNGKPYLLTPGKDGVTEEIITVLRESYHAERLNDRYEDEKQDPQFKHATSLHATNPMHPEAPIDRLEDVSFAPEAQLCTEEIPPSLLDQMRDLIPHLIPSQQELFWKLCEGQKLIDIAREEGTTDNAIRSRRAKMIKRIKALYTQAYGDQ